MADSANSTNPFGVTLTRKDERYAQQQAANAEYFAAIANLRREAATEIERLIKLLDDLGGDPDLEANGDNEPTLGWPLSGPRPLRGPQEDGELEYSLGWTKSGAHGVGDDLEADPCDRGEPETGL